ncbi:excisionase family DNA binding protein [Deinococcus sp. HSC-46F16]|uniref:helix-turn-helix domain-containing protein n=1 Tax=Deinococcus sp. HSC-46F16 TaxID=2910968 RepID=UPI0020A045B2|nr:helix-turn-helix domain-containing protein [Deinococcus sp. HSC-46F16]MCP2015649.1 excisionase family DNA binding protein [Deinococcus sp. HSC-46F16]
MTLAYTYEEAAQQLRCDKKLIRELVASGELVAFTVSSHRDARSVRISRAELERFIATREEAQRTRFGDLTLGNTARNSA